MGPERIVSKFNPFPGLRPFLPEESDLFFGREGESEEVLAKLLKNRFVTVMGASGTGKSSLIYCGILPKVKKLAETGDAWKILTFRPGNDPIGNLAEIIIHSVNPNDTRESFKHEIIAALSANPDALSVIIKDLVIRGNERVLILVDQFEELFRYSMSGTGAVPGKNAITFVNLLENAVTRKGVEIYSIITMRSDFIGECAHFQGLTQLINSSNYLVPHMSRENYRSAIEGPVKYAGATIDPKLVETLLADIGDQTDQLPVLQHALMRTWSYWQELDDPGRAISFSEYDAVGTMTDAMSRHANEAFEELSPRGREICEKTFRTITEKGADNKGIRHPSRVRVIKNILGCSSEELFEVIEKFRITSRSFITPRENVPLDDDSVIDVSHESLMRLWDRLRHWVDDEASSVHMYLRLSEASAMYQQGKTTLWRPPDLQLAINWREQQKPTLQWAERYDPAFERTMVYLRTSEKEYMAEEENKIRLQKRQIKRTKIIAFILGTAALISIGFMLFAFVQKIAADRATILADENARNALIQKHLADSNRTVAEIRKLQADSSRQDALEQKAIADTQRNEAFFQKTQAQINEIKATNESTRATREADSAKAAQARADQSRKYAEEQSDIAKSRRMLAIGKQISIKSLQAQDKDLQTLLAYQGYLFNTRHGGEPNDADIYQGLYNVAKKYGNVNYKTFKGHSGAVKSIAFVPGKREFYTSGEDQKVLKWTLDSKEQKIQIVYSGKEIIEVLAVSPDAEWLACGGNNSVIRMIPIKGGSSMQYELKGHTGSVKSLLFSFDGKYLYSASLDGKVLKWDLAARTSASENPGEEKISYIDISSNGNFLAGVSNDGRAIVWDTGKRTDIFRVPVESPGRNVKVVRFKPGENTIAVGYTDGYLELWDITSRKMISKLKAHDADVNDIRFNSSLAQMATAGNDKLLKLWDTADLTTLPITFNDNGDDGKVLVIEFSPDGQFIISGTYENTDNLLGRPTSVNLITTDICNTLTRNLTDGEWATYIGKDIPPEKTCSENEFNIKKVNVIR
jgi:WD40 repeat protein